MKVRSFKNAPERAAHDQIAGEQDRNNKSNSLCHQIRPKTFKINPKAAKITAKPAIASTSAISIPSHTKTVV